MAAPVDVQVPNVGESVAQVYIGKWFAPEGTWVDAETPIVMVESDKATFEVPSPAAGFVRKILKKEGDTAAKFETIAQIEPAPKPADAGGKPAPAAGGNSAPTKTDGEKIVMPAAERAAHEKGVNAQDVKGTGPGGRVLKEDVIVHKAAEPKVSVPAAAPKTTAVTQVPSIGPREERRQVMSPIRQTIAKRLVEAQHNAALLTTFNEVDMTALMNLRKNYQDFFTKKYGIKIGYMSFFVKAVVDALNQFPQVGAQVSEDGRELLYFNYVDVGVAIGGGRGLVVPVLRNAERMSFAEIELAIADFAKRAQENRLGREELIGGTFTISNGGVYGSLLSTPIVNAPQSGVLGMHNIVERPIALNGQVVIRPMMYTALTYDHRVVDGREAVSFLKRIKDVIEDPTRIILEV
jgi:2-oxoglutarate dehydrogenase E2 component (dihydrolipoamide succinyltransferase)